MGSLGLAISESIGQSITRDSRGFHGQLMQVDFSGRGVRLTKGLGRTLEMGQLVNFDDVIDFPDHRGVVHTTPPHTLPISGSRTGYNVLAALGITDESNWVVDAGSELNYLGNGRFRLTRNSSAGGSMCHLVALPGVDIENRTFSAYVKVWPGEESSGSEVRGFTTRGAGPTTGDFNTFDISSYSESNPAYLSGTITGSSGQTGVRFGFSDYDVLDHVDVLYFEFPTLIDDDHCDWVGVIPLDTPTGEQLGPNPGPNFVSSDEYVEVTSVADIAVVNGAIRYTKTTSGYMTGRYTGAPDGGFVAGRTYCINIDAENNHASDNLLIRHYDDGAYTTLATYAGGDDRETKRVVFTAGSGSQYIEFYFLTNSSSASIDIFELDIFEATTGFEQSDRTQANTIDSYFVTQDIGELLTIYEHQNIGRLSAYAPAILKTWEASTVYTVGQRLVPGDWATNYNRNRYLECTTAGTSGSAEPDWSGYDEGDTFNDGTAVFTVRGYYTIRGLDLYPECTQTLPTGSVTADGGSSSSLPTEWVNQFDPDGIISVVGYGVSPVNPDFMYVDVRFNNTSGSATTGTLRFSSSSIDGLTTNDDVTFSSWLSVVSGDISTGSFKFLINSRDYSNADLTTYESVALGVDGELKRFSTTQTVTDATADKYRALLRCEDIPNGASVTIRITMPNLAIQSHLSAFIGEQATRTTMAGCLKYSIDNFSQNNFLARVVFSMGVPQDDIDSVTHVLSAGSTANLLFFSGAGKLQAADGTSYSGRNSWSAPASTDFVCTTKHKAGSTFGVHVIDQDNPDFAAIEGSYDGSVSGGTPDYLNIGKILPFPMTIRSLIAAKGGWVDDTTNAVGFAA